MVWGHRAIGVMARLYDPTLSSEPEALTARAQPPKSETP